MEISTKEEVNLKEITPIVDDVSLDKNCITIVGSIDDLERFSKDEFNFMIKKRRAKEFCNISLKWLNQQWTAILDVTKYDFNRGIWDFYLYDIKADMKYRVKITEDIDVRLVEEGVYNSGGTSLRFNLYRTIKDSLSLNIKTAQILLEELSITKKESQDFDVEFKAMIKDELVQKLCENNKVNVVFIERQTLKQYKTLASYVQNDKWKGINFELNYPQLIDFENIQSDKWDCYFQIYIGDDVYLFRMHKGENKEKDSIEETSCVEFKDNYVYQVCFYETVNHNLSIKIYKVPTKQKIEWLSIESNTLFIHGYSYLNIINTSPDKSMKRSLIIRKRDSDKKVVIKLSPVQTKRLIQTNHFEFELPLRQILDLEVVEKEIFDFSIQIDYEGAVYEKRLGFNQHARIKDNILNQYFMRNKTHYTGIYLTQTPGGNLKIETCYLTIWAYYYLKYIRKLDLKLNESKDVWLIGERADTAQDTGYHFYKYCRKYHPEIEAYYVINASSKDRKNVESLGNVLYTGTLKHVRKASIAKTFIGSHEMDNILPLKGFEFDNYTQGKRIFLQHGVIAHKKVDYNKSYYHYPFNLFCVSSLTEKNLVEKEMEYKPSEVKITGLSRFDALLDERKERRSILFMPTWRDWLGNDDKFRKSDYYYRYKSLLTNERLIQLLEQYQLTLDFYPHYRMQPFIEEFKYLKSDCINIIELGEKTVQSLLKENKIMITDYSSVAFDFNYMSKPIVYYHFDFEKMIEKDKLRRNPEAYLGDICRHEDEVIDSIQYYIEHNFKERKEVVEKKGNVFSHIDSNNNKRIFDEINKLK